MLLFPIRPPRRVAYMPGSFFMSLRERCGVAPWQNGWAQALITGWESPCAAAFWATQVSPLRCGVWRQNLRIARINAKGCRGETCLARLTAANRRTGTTVTAECASRADERHVRQSSGRHLCRPYAAEYGDRICGSPGTMRRGVGARLVSPG